MLSINKSTNPSHNSHPEQTVYSDIDNYRMTQGLIKAQTQLTGNLDGIDEVITNPNSKKADQFRTAHPDYRFERSIPVGNERVLAGAMYDVHLAVRDMLDEKRTDGIHTLVHSPKDSFGDEARLKKLLSGQFGEAERAIIQEIPGQSEQQLVTGLVTIHNQERNASHLRLSERLAAGREIAGALSTLVAAREERFGKEKPEPPLIRWSIQRNQYSWEKMDPEETREEETLLEEARRLNGPVPLRGMERQQRLDAIGAVERRQEERRLRSHNASQPQKHQRV